MKTQVPADFRLANPEMFPNFVKLSFHKPSTNISNDMIKKVIFSAALLFAGSAVIAQPKVIAHRGYWTAPESAQNSLASFTKADAIGAYGSEIDVWLTADNKLIVNHDRKYKGTDVDHGEIHGQGDHGHRAAQRREHPHVRRLPQTRGLETRHAPDSRNEVAFGLQPRGSRRQNDRQGAQKIQRAGPDRHHRLLDQRLPGIQKAPPRYQNLLPQRRPASQEHQKTGTGRASTTRWARCASIPNG